MLKPEQYIKTVRRPYPPLYVSLILYGLDLKYLKPFLNRPATIHDTVFVDNCWHYSNRDLQNIGKQVFKEWNNEQRIKQVYYNFLVLEKNFEESTKKSYPEFSRAFKEYMPSMITVYAVDQLVNNKLRNLFNKKISKEETERIMDKLNSPMLDNFYKQEEYDLVTTKDLKNHVKKYVWINSRYGDIKPYTISEAKDKLKKINRKEFLIKWRREKEDLKKVIKKSKNILGNRESYLVDLMQFIVYYRTQRTDLINKCVYLFTPNLKKWAKNAGISYEQILTCSDSELLSRIPSRDILNQRIKKAGVLVEKDKLRIFTGREYDKIQKYFDLKTESKKELSGQIACKGMAIGKAKLIYSIKDFVKIKTGDILITSMTNPHMVPIMKKAGAFVTDEGGITCHAAIMAREMKKPCLIGTHTATKAFKDGDMVEVDANKGIVKKI